MEELVGTYQATRYRNVEQGFMVGFLEDKTQLTGPAEPCPEPGMTYRFFGHWKTSPKYGKQFKFAVFTSHAPHTRTAVVTYLVRTLRGTGIGQQTIERIWDLYQSEAVRTLRMNPAKVAEDLKIDVSKCRAASDRLDEHTSSENTTVDLIGLFAGRGFPMATVKEAIDRWGTRAPGLIRRDPYLLMTHRLPGAGFARCDTLYQSLGLDLSKLKRQTICLWHHLFSMGSGDTWHPYKDACDGLRRKIGGVDVTPNKAIRLGMRARWIAIRKDSDGKGWLADGKSARNEHDLADMLIQLNTAPVRWPEVNHGLSDHQAEQVSLATSTAIGILSGTPGTGKTYSAAAIIREILNRYGHGDVCVLAPTGKAAVRATESLAKAGIQGLTATTIHRALGIGRNGHGDGDWGFRYDRKNPLPQRFIIVDETSMVDTNLLCSLVSATKQGTQILLIGDPYQLPPVGHGAPFRDLIAAGISHGCLTEIQRNSGLIVKGCASIRQGNRVEVCQRFDDEGNNLRIVPSTSPAATMTTIRAVFEAVVRKGARDPIEDIQVLVAMNEAGVLGRKKLNSQLQAILNADGTQIKDNPFRLGDKVICTSNGWYPSMSGAVTGGVTLPEFLANGDIGRVTEVGIGLVVMEFPSVGDGPRRVRIQLGTEWAKNFELAYAITCHKSQGSEWPVVIILADESASRVASREWWYTAVSRAKDRCLIIGKQSVMEAQARRQLLNKRKTFLVEIIKEITEERKQWLADHPDLVRSDSALSLSPSTPENSTLSPSTV
jgi:exodeoxyribonuclease V alpha subunit